MKKLLAIVLCLVFCLSLVACGGNTASDSAKVAKYVNENKEELVSAKRNEGGFVHTTNVLAEDEKVRNTFK